MLRGRHPRVATAATAARCSRASPPATKQWVFYTDGDGQFDPAELELLVRARVGRRRRRAGLQAPARRQPAPAGHRARVPPVRRVLLRAADPRHRLRLPAHPPELARGDRRSCTRPASSAWSSCGSCRTAGARFTEVGVHHYRRVHELDLIERALADQPEVAVGVADVQAEHERHEPVVHPPDDTPSDVVGAAELVALHDVDVVGRVPRRAARARRGRTARHRRCRRPTASSRRRSPRAARRRSRGCARA